MATSHPRPRMLLADENGQIFDDPDLLMLCRKGNEWWIGVMNGDKAREIEIPLDFLKKQKNAVLLFDDENELASVVREDRKVSKQEVLKVKLRAGGGFVGRFY